MRPLPSEVIAGVRRILKETIEPELTSGHAKSRLSEIRGVLAQVDWDDVGFVLAARNRSLAGALVDIEAWRAADPARAAAFPGTETGLPDEDTLAAHQESYRRLAAAAVALVDPFGHWLAAHPSDVRARELRQGLLGAL